jgi:hypothetical protein
MTRVTAPGPFARPRRLNNLHERFHPEDTASNAESTMDVFASRGPPALR